MAKEQKKTAKTIQELEAPKVDLTVDTSRIDREPDRERPMGRAYPTSRSSMPEDQLFQLAEYRPQDAERTGYSNYSYWRSVWSNFLKRKSAVTMLIIFILLFVICICFIIASRPLLRVGDRCSFRPIRSMKYRSASRIS